VVEICRRNTSHFHPQIFLYCTLSKAMCWYFSLEDGRRGWRPFYDRPLEFRPRKKSSRRALSRSTKSDRDFVMRFDSGDLKSPLRGQRKGGWGSNSAHPRDVPGEFTGDGARRCLQSHWIFITRQLMSAAICSIFSRGTANIDIDSIKTNICGGNLVSDSKRKFDQRKVADRDADGDLHN
jgi:hypothetical protein